ncbi:MAG: C39 family peptidase [Acutalibacteraceae bacterium]|nr:C39 family peptidase [Acutalibacteraceae bacterium]
MSNCNKAAVLQKKISDSDNQPDIVDNNKNTEKYSTEGSAKLQRLKAFTGYIPVKIIIVALSILGSSGFTAFYATHFDPDLNIANATQATSATSIATEPATQRVVSSTDETLKFNKDKYSVTVGKTTKTSYTYTPPYKEASDKPEITYTSNNIDIATVDENGKIKGIKIGKTSIVALSSTGIYTTVPVVVKAPKSHKIDDVPMLSQGSTYPSGCESVSSTMLLNYYGFKMDTDTFIHDYLPMADLTYNKKGKMTAPDTHSVFIGSPYSKTALGCFPPVIKNAMNAYLIDEDYTAVDITGSSMKSLINNYIANDQPVLIWATMWMQEPVATYEWEVKGAKSDSPYKDGDTCKWLANEHCMVLIGYDEDYYYLNDPLNYSTTSYSRSTFEKRYEQMGKCALVLKKTSDL